MRGGICIHDVFCFIYIFFVTLISKQVISMTIERTDKEVIIRLPVSEDTEEIEQLLKYARHKEITSKSKATQEQIDELVKEVKKGWWEKNRSRLIKNA